LGRQRLADRSTKLGDTHEQESSEEDGKEKDGGEKKAALATTMPVAKTLRALR